MKILLLYHYPPLPSGLAIQGDLLYRGLVEIGADVHAVHLESDLEKEWYYRWFAPDVVVGVGYWGHTPHIVMHPQKHGMLAVPWLVADGYIANYQDVLNALPLILVTSNWVKEMYVRDGIDGDRIEVLPVGCDTDSFIPHSPKDPKVSAVREAMGVSPDQLMILTIGGDAASKGGQEVMRALAMVRAELPDWKYVCKVWPQHRTELQNIADLELAAQLGLKDRVHFSTSIISRDYVPYLLSACDIYAAPSRLEGFGMLQVEAGACEKPVIGINAMGMMDTLVHGETALLANVAEKITVDEVTLGVEAGYKEPTKVRFDIPRTVDYRANVEDIARHLVELANHPALRLQLGKAARARAISQFNYKVVAKRFLQLLQDKLWIS
jgi:glycosyltransferase involved in cell wall biosynthesis